MPKNIIKNIKNYYQNVELSKLLDTWENQVQKQKISLFLNIEFNEYVVVEKNDLLNIENVELPVRSFELQMCY